MTTQLRTHFSMRATILVMILSFCVPSLYSDSYNSVCRPFNCSRLKCVFGVSVKEDMSGCDVCTCNPPPCLPVTCTNKCPMGFMTDKYKCPTCECVTTMGELY